MARPRRARSATGTLPCKFGAHMSIAGGYERAVVAAHAVGFQAVQLFTKNNNQWKAPALTAEQAAAFRQALSGPGSVIPWRTRSYLINLASPDDALWQRSIDAMVVEMQRCHQLGSPIWWSIPALTWEQARRPACGESRCAIDELHRANPGSGRDDRPGNDRGAGVLAGLSVRAFAVHPGACGEHRRRLGVCVDTCHIFAAGYSLDRPERYDETIQQLDGTIGIDRFRVWHLNDSCRECGSRVDRHAGIGAGKMGLEPFRHLVNDPGSVICR